MGEDKWSHREPGSVTGSVVPPPVVPDESPPIPPPLPRRRPMASGHQRAADADKLITPVRRVSGSPAPDLSVGAPRPLLPTQPGPTQSGPTHPGPTQARSTQARSTRRSSGPGQRRLELAQPPAAAAPELPDNVRYLFKPVITRTAPSVEPADTDAKPTDAKPDAELGTAPHTSAGRAGAPAADIKRPKTVAAAGKLRRRLTLAAAVLVVASTAVGTAFALVRHRPSADSAIKQNAASHHSTRDSRASYRAVPGLSSGAIASAQAARWVARDISKSAIIACDAMMCTRLYNQGIAESNLLVLSPTAPSPLGADVVIGTRVVRSQFGRLLATEYAPTVIASFGAGKSRVDVRAIAPYGAGAYRAALSHDLAARQRYGGELLRDSRISVSASARPELIAGLVDPRLLMMLPVLASEHPIRILGFFDRGPRSAQGVPLGGAELAGYHAAAGVSAGGYLRWLLVFLRGQRAPYWPTSVTTTRVGGHEIVRIRFSRPSPIGLLNGQ